MKSYKKIIIVSLTLILIFSLLIPKVLSVLSLPNYCQIIEGNQELLETNLPFKVLVRVNQSGNLKINGKQVNQQALSVNLKDNLALYASAVGKYDLDFRLFGIIPLQKMIVNVVPEVKVIPGGQAIGVILKSDGIMVVKNSYVVGADGHRKYPAKEAGIEVGDSILTINGVNVKSKYHLARLIHSYAKSDKAVKVKLRKQNDNIITKKVYPVKNQKGYYMIGIYVDDGASGVGTISFYDPKNGYYGALGHMITEANTQLKVDVGEGEIVRANISGINLGQQGLPGEKLGTFFNKQGVLGNIIKNNNFGIYGELSVYPEHPYFKEAIPVASSLEVEEGLADIYTVISGGEIEKFKVRIEKVKRQYHPREKGLVIKIVDAGLLNKTGGIIQGMSGSPIVQNGKLVGAVTHVFVNDATRGYGILAQWMLQQSKLLKQRMNTRKLVS